jgi:hypothetical protein
MPFFGILSLFFKVGPHFTMNEAKEKKPSFKAFFTGL